jgi:hypothetical protein
MWNLSAPPGFRGFDPQRPVRRYLRHLPHWRQDGATYFVTFRLADSLPAFQLRYFRALKREWQRKHPQGSTNDADWQKLADSISERMEAWLDQGRGSCWLRDPHLAMKVAETLEHFDGERYCLGAYVLMPNHVHLLVRPFAGEYALEDILQSWKRHSATSLNTELARTGPVWMDESYDRIVRDEEHLYYCLQYIGSNAKRAGLNIDSVPRWVRPEWIAAGWKFVD